MNTYTQVFILKETNFLFIMETAGLKEFDCNNKHHVLWLQKFTDCIQKMDLTNSRKMGVLLSNNPMGVTMRPEAFIDIHAGLSIKYAGNVLNGTAWIPKSEN